MDVDRPFEVEVRDLPRGAVASLRGEASNDRAENVHQALSRLLEQRTQQVVIDLRELSFIASMTLAELISFRREMQSYGGRLRLAGATDPIVSVFKTTHLADLFPMFDTPEAALDDEN
jgi:anti-anti-sigma factor